MRLRFDRSFALASLALVSVAGAAWAGPPFRTDDPEPVDYRHWEVYGSTNGTETADDKTAFLPAVEVNYGAAPNLQLHIIVPMALDAPKGAKTQYGIGDMELGVKYRFVEQDKSGWMPSVGIFPLIELPTGDQSRGLGAGDTQVFLPVWIQKDWDKWTTYGGGGYWFNPGAGNQDYWFTGWLVQRHITEKLALGGELFHQTASTVSGRDSSGFNLGGVYDFNEHYHLLFSAGKGLQDARETNRFSYYLAIQKTF